MIDFVGIGAQRSGTSWIYACLYEHPEICIPIKEPHFFSREDKYNKGLGWYLDIYKKCPTDSKKGEFSTSYLYSEIAANRIFEHFPNAKIIVSLRNPVERAYSQYINALKAGEISKETSFDEALNKIPSLVEQGRYHDQLCRYRDLFKAENILVLIYEDSLKNPAKFISEIYSFLGIRENFRPSMLERRVNTSRVPKRVFVDRIMIHVAEFLRKIGFDRLVWLVKKSGIPQKIRRVNTGPKKEEMSEATREALKGMFRSDAEKLSSLVGRDLVKEWNLN